MPLRNELLHTCQAANLTVQDTVQSIVDALMISVIMIGPDADAAEQNIRNITNDMLANIRKSYGEFHDMAESQQSTRQ